MSNKTRKNSAILLMHCPDQSGIVANITQFIVANNGNILALEQHVDHQTDIFFMRIEWDLDSFWIPEEKIEEKFQPLADKYGMIWKLHFGHRKERLGVIVSEQAHCLHEIIAQQETGEWPFEIAVVISNHETLRPISEKFDIPFFYVPVTPTTKAEAEAEQIRILAEYEVGTVILARYMQIVTPEFINHFPHQIINIHHSFLPAFIGARPYHQAFERGVKILGATSHYVTNELDAGPIIEQNVARISHQEHVTDLIRIGRDLEKLVLARAIWHHTHHKVLVYDNKTVIFS